MQAFEIEVNADLLEDSVNCYVASFTPASWATRKGASPFLQSRTLLVAGNLAEAVKNVDSYVAQRVFQNIRTSG